MDFIFIVLCSPFNLFLIDFEHKIIPDAIPFQKLCPESLIFLIRKWEAKPPMRKNTHMEHAIQVEPDERKCGRKEEGNATISVNHCTPAGW